VEAGPFSDFFTAGQRARAWTDGLRRAGIGPASRGVDGTLRLLAAGDGPVLARIACGATGLTFRVPGSGGLWVAVPLGGTVRRDGAVVRDIEAGTADASAEIAADPHARLLFGRFRAEPERAEPGARCSPLLGVFLRAVAGTIDQLDPVDLGAIEAAVTAILSVPVAAKQAPAARGTRASFQRFIRSIEPRLPDPALSLAGIAKEQGVSERYLRRLFETNGTRFGNYVRARRLEHCKADLDDPALSGEPVASIGFRWGFNDPAHFSRAFREEFGLPPRAYRETRRGNCRDSGPHAPMTQALRP
jgi:AraC-like DNA-binding protein